MKPRNICIVVFNRYDLLTRLVDSLRVSELAPSAIYIIDRGNNSAKLREAIAPHIPGCPFHLVKLPGQCLAAAWNWFLKNVPEERILVSDDIVFGPTSLREFVETEGDFVGIEDEGSSHFACFLMRDSCVRKVGLFDEGISPDYMYFEDCDYGMRMELERVPLKSIRSLKHENSASLAAKTPEQVLQHHRLFEKAQANYVYKWGALPTPGKW